VQMDKIEKQNLINYSKLDTLQLKEWWPNLIQKSIVKRLNWKKFNKTNKWWPNTLQSKEWEPKLT
jgi:hypothetical protein